MTPDPGETEGFADGYIDPVLTPGLSSEGESPGVALDRALDRAHRRMRITAKRIDPIATKEGWPVPFSPVRLLVLQHLGEATAFGLTPRRLAHHLDLKPSSLAHHLDILDDAGLIQRRPRDLYDRRKVAVRLTDEGAYAVRRLGSVLQGASP